MKKPLVLEDILFRGGRRGVCRPWKYLQKPCCFFMFMERGFIFGVAAAKNMKNTYVLSLVEPF